MSCRLLACACNQQQRYDLKHLSVERVRQHLQQSAVQALGSAGIGI